jgi:hypothetical protein
MGVFVCIIVFLTILISWGVTGTLIALAWYHGLGNWTLIWFLLIPALCTYSMETKPMVNGEWEIY